MAPSLKKGRNNNQVKKSAQEIKERETDRQTETETDRNRDRESSACTVATRGSYHSIDCGSTKSVLIQQINNKFKFSYDHRFCSKYVFIYFLLKVRVSSR